MSVLSAIAAIVYYATDPRRPHAATPDNGWWLFSDQQRYLLSALAWSHGRIDPAEHYYMPGYGLLAAPFLRLTHSNPFLLPDLAMQVITLVLAACIAGWLAPAWRWGRVAGAGAALVAMSTPASLEVWVTPWTSTPEAALTLGALLATLHLEARPANWRAALSAGLCAGAVAAFRPFDAVVLSSMVAAASLAALLLNWPGMAAAVRTAAAGVLGASVTVGLAIGLYVSINGWRLSDYLTLSAAIGFEWRLLPVRWVTIMISPRPFFGSERGLIEVFPWVPFGLAGVIACLIKPPAAGRRLSHLLVAGAVCLHTALYLCYRDLHPLGLWRYYNYHYFKWPVVLLAVYAALLCETIRARQWSAASAGAVVACLLLAWRVNLVPEQTLDAGSPGGALLRLPPLALTVGTALLIPANGEFDAIYNTQHNLYVGDHEEKWYSSTGDFKVMPGRTGLMIVPLRPLRTGPVAIHFGAGVALGNASPIVAREQILFGLPCWTRFLCKS